MNLIKEVDGQSSAVLILSTTLLDESLNKSGIAKKLNVSSGAIGRSLNRLLDDGFIEMENNKYYMPNFVFKACLKNEYRTRGIFI
ncbi:winged helix-turn-helix transcriptional regulator [Methanobrevibacter sp.]